MTNPWTSYSHAERPDLEAQLDSLKGVWPQFIYHGDTSAKHYHHTTTTFADFNLYVCDAQGNFVGSGLGLPLVWNGDAESLPLGWDDSVERGVDDFKNGRQCNTLSLLGITVPPNHQRQGWSSRILQALKAKAAEHGLTHVIAPVRPTLKSLYPLIPMEQYVMLRRDDGTHFDPWIRVHEQAGATIAPVAERSMTITGTVTEWEEWTDMRLPCTGSYIIPGALTPLEIDCEQNLGTYVEPNVWMIHRACA